MVLGKERVGKTTFINHCFVSVDWQAIAMVTVCVCVATLPECNWDQQVLQGHYLWEGDQHSYCGQSWTPAFGPSRHGDLAVRPHPAGRSAESWAVEAHSMMQPAVLCFPGVFQELARVDGDGSACVSCGPEGSGGHQG